MKMTVAKTSLLALLTLTIAASVGFTLIAKGQAVNDLSLRLFGSTSASSSAHSDQQLKHLTETLELSKEQQQQIKPILRELDAKTSELMNDRSVPSADRRARISQLRAESNQRIWELLTEGQKKKAIQLRNRRPANDRWRERDQSA